MYQRPGTLCRVPADWLGTGPTHSPLAPVGVSTRSGRVLAVGSCYGGCKAGTCRGTSWAKDALGGGELVWGKPGHFRSLGSARPDVARLRRTPSEGAVYVLPMVYYRWCGKEQVIGRGKVGHLFEKPTFPAQRIPPPWGGGGTKTVDSGNPPHLSFLPEMRFGHSDEAGSRTTGVAAEPPLMREGDGTNARPVHSILSMAPNLSWGSGTGGWGHRALPGGDTSASGGVCTSVIPMGSQGAAVLAVRGLLVRAHRARISVALAMTSSAKWCKSLSWSRGREPEGSGPPGRDLLGCRPPTRPCAW